MVHPDNLLEVSPSIDSFIQWLREEQRGGAEYVTIRINDSTVGEMDDEELEEITIKEINFEAE